MRIFRYSISVITLLLTASTAWPSPVLSASGEGDFRHTRNGDSIHTILPDLEVTAAGGDKDVKSSVPTFMLTAEGMRQKGITGIADALRRLPGVTLKDYGGAGGMKTVAVRGLGAQHTGVALDGITLSDARSGQIDLSRYSLENLSCINLTLGDGDDIFQPARNASTPSLLEISSLAAPDKAGGSKLRAQFKFGSFQYLGGYLRWSQNVSDRVALSANGEFIHAKNDYPFRLRNLNVTTHERRANSRMNSGNGDVSAAWRPSGSTLVSARLHYYDNDRQLPGQVRYYTNYSRETLRDRNFFAQTSIKSRLSQIFSIRGDAKFNWDTSKYRDPGYPGGVRDADYYQREAYVSAALLCTPHPDWAFSYAADYSYTNLNAWQKNAPDPKPRRNIVYQALTARFSNGRLSATARLLLTLSYNRRQDGEKARDERRLSPSLSASWKILDSEDLFLRASYKDIFRLPTFTESYYFHFGSANLLPEKTQQFNIGATWQHDFNTGTSLKLTADGYLNLIRDMIVAVPYNMFIWTNINLGKATAKGVDVTASLTQRLAKGHTLLFSANWSWQRVLNHTDKASPYYGNQPAYIPVNSGAASLTWENPWVNLSVSGTAVSSRWTTSEHYAGTRVGGYADFNVGLYRTINLGSRHSLDLRADLRNVLNRQYEIIKLYPMPRFNYMASIAWNFQ